MNINVRATNGFSNTLLPAITNHGKSSGFRKINDRWAGLCLRRRTQTSGIEDRIQLGPQIRKFLKNTEWY